jgi:hypothetical protein
MKPAKAGNAAAPESGPCHIGVIPIVGNLFRVEKFELPFGDRLTQVATEGWALDELVVSRVRAAAHGNSVRRIPFTAEELIRDAQQRPISLFNTEDVRIKEFAQDIAGRIRCERYVVVHRRGFSSKESGIGISIHFKAAFLFAMTQIRIYDGRSFNLIKQGPALIDESTAFSGSPGGPSRVVDLSALPDKLSDAAASPVLRDGVRALLTASLDKTLPMMLRP